jgi:shikimate kinase
MIQPLPNNGNIYLCGFMGSGKSTVGPIVASNFGVPFVDSDAVVVSMAKKSIRMIFETEGEGGFRKWESAVISQIAKSKNQVVALGGGSLLLPANREKVLKTGILVYLKASLPVLIGRIVNTDRPKLDGVDAGGLMKHLTTLLNARSPQYELADILIETDGIELDDIAKEIISGVSKWKP